MTRLLSTAAFLLLCVACSRPPASTPYGQTVAQEVKEITRQALSQAEIQACDHMPITVGDPSKETPYPADEPRKLKGRVSDMTVGEEGLVWGIYRDHGKLYIDKYEQVTSGRDGISKIHVRRVKDGLLTDCRCSLYILENVDGPRNTAVDLTALIPVVGTF